MIKKKILYININMARRKTRISRRGRKTRRTMNKRTQQRGKRSGVSKSNKRMNRRRTMNNKRRRTMNNKRMNQRRANRNNKSKRRRTKRYMGGDPPKKRKMFFYSADPKFPGKIKKGVNPVFIIHDNEVVECKVVDIRLGTHEVELQVVAGELRGDTIIRGNIQDSAEWGTSGDPPQGVFIIKGIAEAFSGINNTSAVFERSGYTETLNRGEYIGEIYEDDTVSYYEVGTMPAVVEYAGDTLFLISLLPVDRDGIARIPQMDPAKRLREFAHTLFLSDYSDEELVPTESNMNKWFLWTPPSDQSVQSKTLPLPLPEEHPTLPHSFADAVHGDDPLGTPSLSPTQMFQDAEHMVGMMAMVSQSFRSILDSPDKDFPIHGIQEVPSEDSVSQEAYHEALLELRTTETATPPVGVKYYVRPETAAFHKFLRMKTKPKGNWKKTWSRSNATKHPMSDLESIRFPVVEGDTASMEYMRQLIKRTMNLINPPDDGVTTKIIKDIMSFGKLFGEDIEWNDVFQLFDVFMGLNHNRLDYEDFTDYNPSLQYTIAALEDLINPAAAVSMDTSVPELGDNLTAALAAAEGRLQQVREASSPPATAPPSPQTDEINVGDNVEVFSRSSENWEEAVVKDDAPSRGRNKIEYNKGGSKWVDLTDREVVRILIEMG